MWRRGRGGGDPASPAVITNIISQLTTQPPTSNTCWHSLAKTSPDPSACLPPEEASNIPSCFCISLGTHACSIYIYIYIYDIYIYMYRELISNCAHT